MVDEAIVKRGGERPEQTGSLPSVENPSLNLRTSKLLVNVGVPYSRNKKIVKKSSTDTADSTPHPTNKPDDSTAADSEMFVDLSPLDSAQQVVRGPANRQERHQWPSPHRALVLALVKINQWCKILCQLPLLSREACPQ